MIKNRTLTKCLVILLIFGSLFSCRKKTEDPSIVRLSKYNKSLVEAYKHVGLFCATNQIPGLTIAVTINNELVWADGFGYSNLEFKVKSLPTHKFRIGQLTELIAGLTAAKLYDEGKLQIDTPVAEYLPDADKAKATYTIRELASHTAGIREESMETADKFDSMEKIVDSFIREDLMYEPGQYYGHSGLGYDLLGFVIEKSQKSNYAKVVKTTLVDNLELNNTVADNPFQVFGNRSSGYEVNYIAQPIVAKSIDLRGREASAGYLSSVLDLVKMGNVILYPGFLKPETLDLITTPYKLKSGLDGIYGFGLISSKDNRGKRFYGAQGAITGGSASLLIYPDDKMVIAIAANINGETLDLPVFQVADIFKKQLHPESTQDSSEVKKEIPEVNQEKEKK